MQQVGIFCGKITAGGGSVASGGDVSQTLTHVVVGDFATSDSVLRTAEFKALREAPAGGSAVVKYRWIVDSLRQNKVAPVGPYLVPGLEASQSRTADSVGSAGGAVNGTAAVGSTGAGVPAAAAAVQAASSGSSNDDGVVAIDSSPGASDAPSNAVSGRKRPRPDSLDGAGASGPSSAPAADARSASGGGSSGDTPQEPPAKRQAVALAALCARPAVASSPSAAVGAATASAPSTRPTLPGCFLPRPLPTQDAHLPTPVPLPSLPSGAPALARAAGIARLPPWAMSPVDVTAGPGRVNAWLLTSDKGLDQKDIAAAGATVLQLPPFSAAMTNHGSVASISTADSSANALHCAPCCGYASAVQAMSPASLGTCAFASFVPDGWKEAQDGGSGEGAGAESSSSSAPQFVAVPPRPCILAFDIDGTLIKPSNAKASFCATASDWVPWHPRVFEVLRSAYAAGFKLVLVSNQKGIAKGHTSLAIVTARVAALARAVGVPMQVFLSVGDDDGYRKPRPGMAWLLAAYCNGGVALNHASCVYVGDAAGRPKGTTGPSPRPRDHSDTDATWALNQGWGFTTPEALFGGSPTQNDREPLWSCKVGNNANTSGAAASKAPASPNPVLDWVPALSLPAPGSSIIVGPSQAAAGATGANHSNPSSLAQVPDGLGPRQEVVLLIGPAGAGKSSLCKTAFSPQAGYVRVNQDALRTRDKCMEVAGAVLEGKPVSLQPGTPVMNSTGLSSLPAMDATPRSVVVDATNLDPAARAAWVAWAKAKADALGRPLPIRCIHLDVDKPTCFHLNALRASWPLGGPDGPLGSAASSRSVPAMVIHGMFKNGRPPANEAEAVKEGFVASGAQSVYVKVRFVPGPFCEGADAPAAAAAEHGPTAASAATSAAHCDSCALARSLIYSVAS